ncbi:hypothetical protein ACH5RR_036593 [Cinchona calisaya]|uniref:Uncharacterized protein n=1 Tax=Cinchona calisaya TaxID=153742 RepID=A0ABD2Y883_9GENT
MKKREENEIIYVGIYKRDIQKSAKNKKTTGSSRRRWDDDDEEVEPPKHEPPPKPLPAESLKSAIKTKVVNKGQRRKVTWAPDVYDPPPSSESHHQSEWPKHEKKKNSRNEWPKEEEGDKGTPGEGGGIDQTDKDFNKKKGKKNGLKEGAAIAGGEGECKKNQKNQHKGGDAGRGRAGAKGFKDKDKKQGGACGDGKVGGKDKWGKSQKA